jgi:tetratricopeptide (TPR) repeat protein
MAQSNLGQALMNEPGRIEEAARHFALAVKADPELAAGHRGLAMVMLQAGMKTEAIEQLETAQRLEPKAEVANLLNQLR